MSEEIKDGKLNAFGMDINISDVIGEKIVDQWLAKLTPEDMNLILNAIEQEAFSHNYNDEKYFITYKESKDRWGDRKKEETPIWKSIREQFAEKFNKIIMEKADEILNSEEFQKRADKIAEELVNYATEGYKDDLKARIKERLVNNTINDQPFYRGIDLRCIINEEIQRYIHS